VIAWQARSEPWAALALVPLLGLVAVAARLRPPAPASLIRDTKPGEAVRLSLVVADALGLHGRDRRDVELTALLQGVGRTRLPRSILDKPGPLTSEEWTVVQTHTVEAERLLARHGGRLGEVGTYVRSCSERWDGAGYPDGLHGRDIPLIARIVAVCGAYEAMTSDRSYRKALTPAQACDELRANAGTQFDPRVVEALLRAV
jgi:HD-GYP domain-containing protein (c-di-GMP phosphodiesterase class II)